MSGKASFSSGMLGRTLRINKSGIMSVYAAVSTVPCCVPVLPCINFAKYIAYFQCYLQMMAIPYLVPLTNIAMTGQDHNIQGVPLKH